MVSNRSNRIFYGWVIVAVALVVGSALFGVRFSYGVFFKSIQAEFELTRTVTSAVNSTFLLFCAVFSFLGGWAIDKYGPRLVIFLLGLITGISLMLISQAHALWQLFLTYGLLLAIGTAAPVPLLSSVVSQWFDKQRGLALGITTSATGLGIVIIAPLSAYLISSLGWRMAYIILGLVIWLIVIPLARLLRRDPGEIGLLPDGVKQEIRSGTVAVKESYQPRLILLKAFRARNFWLMLGTWTLTGICMSLIMTHLVPYATDMGISTVTASTILSLMSGLLIPFELSVGKVSDLVGRKMPGIVCSLFGAVGFVWLAWAHNLGMFYLFAVLSGFAMGGVILINLVIATDTFTVRNIGVILGLLNVGWTVGNAIGSALGGIVFDVTGSYPAAFYTAAAAMLLMAILFMVTRKK
ncbi:MFS transporter [Chloroflexota bacterium]